MGPMGIMLLALALVMPVGAQVETEIVDLAEDGGAVDGLVRIYRQENRMRLKDLSGDWRLDVLAANASGTTGTAIVNEGIWFEGSTEDENEGLLTCIDPTAPTTWTLPGWSGRIVTMDADQWTTLTDTAWVLGAYYYGSGGSFGLGANKTEITDGTVQAIDLYGTTLHITDPMNSSGFVPLIDGVSTASIVNAQKGYSVGGSVLGVWQNQGPIIEATKTGKTYCLEPTLIAPEGGALLLTSGTNVWKMWFRQADISNQRIFYAESYDGINWTQSLNPVLTDHFCPFVIKNSGTYYLYAVKDTWDYIDVYSSADGMTFALLQDEAIGLGGADSWNETALGNCGGAVVGGTLYLYVDGYGDDVIWRLGLYTATDMKTFTPDDGNPVISESGTRGAVTVPQLVGSTYWMWMLGSESGMLPSDIYRYSAPAIDGPWTQNPASGPVFTRTTYDEGVGSDLGQAGDPFILEVDGKTYLYYCAVIDGADPNSEARIKLSIADMPIASLVGTDEGVNAGTKGNTPPNPQWMFRDLKVIGDIETTGTMTVNGGIVWRSNNDGTGSGLDADLLDGHETSYFQASDADLAVLAGITYAQGGIVYGSGAGTAAQLAKDANATRYLSNTGTDNNPAWAQVNLVNGVTGVLSIANGGSATSTQFTQGSVVFAGASGVYSQDNAGLFFDPVTNRLGINTANSSSTLHVNGSIDIGNGGSTVNVTAYDSTRAKYGILQLYPVAGGPATMGSSHYGILLNPNASYGVQFGNAAVLAYSRFGTATTGHSITGQNSLLISGALEVDGASYFDGSVVMVLPDSDPGEEGRLYYDSGTGAVMRSAGP